MSRVALAALLSLAGLLRCGSHSDLPTAVGSGSSDGGSAPADAGATPAPDAGTQAGGWTVAWREDFETLAAPSASWQADPIPDDGPYSDNGIFFQGTRMPDLPRPKP